MKYKYLDDISSPADIKRLRAEEIPELCEELRCFLVETVGEHGGHLASNLGAVELSVALHRIFDSPKDKIIFDVGHQAYVHKIITGRRERFSDLRVPGGLSGFTKSDESEHDPFGAGHSSTSLSAALGFAEANRLEGSDAYTVAVIGDGAYTGGMIHEALNNCHPDLRLIIVLNENGMSISQNRGAFASYFAKARMSEGYMNFKRGTKSFLSHVPLIGKPLGRFLRFMKERIKGAVYDESYFESLGLYYRGPIDGNDYKLTERVLRDAKKLKKCVVVHLKTQKGRGYSPAEERPDGFHSVYNGKKTVDSFHSVFAEELTRLAKEDEKITAVTAAMGIGTGLDVFGASYPERYFDVGIAEEHALTFSAGLAASGYKPFVAIYSTFLQRAYDSILHDVALQNLPVKMMIDRAGLAVSDGATHHGIFDVAFLSHIPSISIYAPVTYESLRKAVREAAFADSPVAVRYANSQEPKNIEGRFVRDVDDPFISLDFDEKAPPRYLYITYGNIVERVLGASDILAEEGIESGVVLLERLKPYEPVKERLKSVLSAAERVVFVEEGIKNGGAAMIFGELVRDTVKDYRIAAIDDNFAAPQEKCDLYGFVGLSPEKIAEKMK
ncbi:MAG: 1-deoxy-D-xylulose-5-phosphate synthase [Clostridia bacterium]|nr:1-deoxy-D-xylulose-5-phosphate synthase [Clostridia bacterium]